ncbi:MAG: DUF4114 domain-containing protein [Lentisphaeria bacterium]
MKNALTLFLMAATSLWLPAALAAKPPTKTPFNLSVLPTTALSQGDAAAQTFGTSLLPLTQSLTSRNLNSGLSLEGYTVQQIDPSKINFAVASASRLYFCGENADYHNSIGFNSAGASVDSGTPKLAFLDSSSPTPRTAGDYVDLGTFAAGTNLDFFVISDGASNLGYKLPNDLNKVLSTDATANLDGLVHFYAYAVKDSPYLLLTVEDTYGGGDLDYNDLIFVVDVGAGNVRTFFAAPEPSLLLILGSFTALLLGGSRRRTA